MGCSAAWNREFLDRHFTQKFLNKDLKAHREAILLERQRSLLPSTQPVVNLEMEVRRRQKTVAELFHEYTTLKQQERAIYGNLERERRELRRFRDRRQNPHAPTAPAQSHSYTVACPKDGCRGFLDDQTFRCGVCETFFCRRCREALTAAEANQLSRVEERDQAGLPQLSDSTLAGEPKEGPAPEKTGSDSAKESSSKKRKRSTTESPPHSNRSTKSRQGGKQNQQDTDIDTKKSNGHQCDPLLVKTIEKIIRESKPCPSCGISISKVSGCDQMWCIQCDTAFSYSTGAKIRGVIHNPHYFERLRVLQSRNQGHPRDGDCQNGIWPSASTLKSLASGISISRNFKGRWCSIEELWLERVQSTGRHVEQVSLITDFPADDNPRRTEELRVQYMLGDCTEKEFSARLQKHEKLREKHLEIRGPLEIFVIVTAEFLHEVTRVLQQRQVPFEDRCNDFYALVKTYTVNVENMVNLPLQQIGSRYHQSVPQIHLKLTDSVCECELVTETVTKKSKSKN